MDLDETSGQVQGPAVDFTLSKTLIVFFSQTIDAFCVSFEPQCYLQFMQQNKIKHG